MQTIKEFTSLTYFHLIGSLAAQGQWEIALRAFRLMVCVGGDREVGWVCGVVVREIEK